MFSLPQQEIPKLNLAEGKGRSEKVYFKRDVCLEILQPLYYILKICNVVFGKSHSRVL